MKAIRASVPSRAKVLAVVKADGYGHGAVETARAAIKGGAEMLAVAAVSEGIQLREAGIQIPILVLGAVSSFDVQAGAEYDLIQTVCTPEMVYLCEKAGEALQKQTEVHLKTDTGMGRIGVRNAEERDLVLDAVNTCPHVKLTGVFTHFSDADGNDEGIEYTKEQFQRFLKLTDPLPETVLRHCCNSAAIHRFPEMALDMVRAGISLYGYPPVPTSTELKPCMTWTASVSYIKELPAGSFVSYGRTYRNDRPIRAATVTCGYADGYFRSCGKQGYVLIREKRD
jgi:alanine racemase